MSARYGSLVQRELSPKVTEGLCAAKQHALASGSNPSVTAAPCHLPLHKGGGVAALLFGQTGVEGDLFLRGISGGFTARLANDNKIAAALKGVV